MAVIETSHLDKVFRIPHEKRNTLFHAVTGVFTPVAFETFHALRDISLSVEDGEMFGIIGDNGSGKSTFLKILSRILVPTSGSVLLKKHVTPFLELGVGFNTDFTAAENIKIYGIIMGLTPREIDDKADYILEFADLARFRDTRLRNFSSGMQVRLAFSTAIQTNPEILLLDEVLAVGDMDFQKKCYKIINTFKNEGVTMVYVSHDLDSVKKYCDRTLLLRKGEQVMIGDSADVIEKYESLSPQGEIPAMEGVRSTPRV
jgi:lipopolysaccharide transport system ATP-binding protein